MRELLVLAASLYPAPMPVDEVLERADLTELADRRTTKLSGGQTQRVRFALALVPDPELLVLDEPTAAMDVETRRRFWAVDAGSWPPAGRTVLFATHYLDEADEYADRIVLMAQGRVVADGPATAIKAVVGGRTIRATLPGVPDGRAGRPARRQRGRAARRRGPAAPAPTPTWRCARCWPATRPPATSRSAAPTSRTPSSLSPLPPLECSA